MINELEDEIKEMRAIVVRTGANNIDKLEKEKTIVINELKDVKDKLLNANVELSKSNEILK